MWRGWQAESLVVGTGEFSQIVIRGDKPEKSD